MVEVHTIRDAEEVVRNYLREHACLPRDFENLLIHAGQNSQEAGQAREPLDEASEIYNQLKEERPEMATKLLNLDDAYSGYAATLADIAYRLGIAAGRASRRAESRIGETLEDVWEETRLT